MSNYPLFRSASWYGDAASLNASSSEDIASGIFLIMLGGWFDLLSTQRGVVVGFEYGLNFPVFRWSVTSRKLTMF